MYRNSIFIVLFAAAAVAIPVTARADDQVVDDDIPPVELVAATPVATPFARHDWAVELNVGIATPTGPLTVSRDFYVDDHVGARASVGLGTIAFTPFVASSVGSNSEVRLSAGVKAGLTSWREQGGWCFSDDCASKRSWTTVFGTVEASVTHRFGSTFFVKPYVGAAAALNPSSLTCAGDDEALAHCMSDHAEDGRRAIYGGLSFGVSW